VRIVVVGAGALGAWAGAMLERGGADVTLVARGAHGEAMAASGVEVRTGDGAFTARPAVVPSVAAAFAAPGAGFDVALVTVKSWASEGVGAELAAAGRVGRVVSLQNGVGNEAVLAAALAHRPAPPPAERAVAVCDDVGAGTVTVGVTVDRPGVVAASTRGGVGLGRDGGGWAGRLATHFAGGGVRVALYDDPLALKWSKLLLNMLGAATTALLDRAPIEVLARREVFAIEVGAWREAMAVMRAHRIPIVDLPGYGVRRLAAAARWVPAPLLRRALGPRLAAARGSRLPGVGADLRAGRSTSEIAVLHGAVAAAGAAAGIATPTCRALTDLVVAVAEGRLARERYAGQPAALAAAVAAARGATGRTPSGRRP